MDLNLIDFIECRENKENLANNVVSPLRVYLKFQLTYSLGSERPNTNYNKVLSSSSIFNLPRQIFFFTLADLT